MRGNGRLRVLLGAGLLVAGLCGVIWGTRVACAQAWYYQAKYGKHRNDCDRILALCQRAFRWYPHNYYFSIFAAEQAYQGAQSAADPKAGVWLGQARWWCERGLAQNRWRSQLRRLKARFLWEASPARAIEYWREHTAWQFWEPHNHAVLAEMYARVGDFEAAAESLYWARRDQNYEATLELVHHEQDKRATEEAQTLLKEWGE